MGYKAKKNKNLPFPSLSHFFSKYAEILYVMEVTASLL